MAICIFGLALFCLSVMSFLVKAKSIFVFVHWMFVVSFLHCLFLVESRYMSFVPCLHPGRAYDCWSFHLCAWNVGGFVPLLVLFIVSFYCAPMISTITEARVP
jgi:hypothetical protein